MYMLLFFLSCITTTTHLSSPYALKPGQKQLTISNAWQMNSVVVGKSIAAGQTIYDNISTEETELSEEDFRTLFDSGLTWILHTPGSSIELLGRVGVTDKFLHGVDVGLRTDFSIAKIE